jgi:manganese/zinc/iron transport system permease protein
MANLPAGAVIVLTASTLFLFSMTFGSAKGVLKLGVERMRLRRRIMRENLLRDLYEYFENVSDVVESHERKEALYKAGPVAADLISRRAWSSRQLRCAIARLLASRDIVVGADQRITFTGQGLQAAQTVIRKHRLWEAYLIAHADVAAGMVDLSADRIEHVLDKEIIDQLEKLFPSLRDKELPESPHTLKTVQRVM